MQLSGPADHRKGRRNNTRSLFGRRVPCLLSVSKFAEERTLSSSGVEFLFENKKEW